MAFPDRLPDEGERVVVSTRTHPEALLLPLLVLGVAAFLLRLGDGRGALDQVVDWVARGVVLLVVLWWVVRPGVAWATTTHTFPNRPSVKRSGLVAEEGRTIPPDRISGVDSEIGIIDRAFGCDTLVVSDADEQGRVDLHHVPRAEQAQLEVAEGLHRLAGRPARTDDGA